MKKTILIGGKAGQGIARTSAFLGKIFTKAGFYVFNYRDYPSLIRGGHNFNILSISDSPIFSFEREFDIILALDQKTITLYKKNLKKGGFILGDKTLRDEKLQEVNLKEILEKLNLPSIFGNNILIGWLGKYFGIPFKIISKTTKEEFGEKAEKIIKSIKEGYKLSFEKEKLKIKKEKIFLSGTEGIGLGALKAGLNIYFAYPMTPATPLLHFLAKKQKEGKILVYQPENEIAVINMALGASYAGAKTMVGTSGGGFDLMAEACSLQGMSEIPLVVYVAQRMGPSTGVPTYTSQGDLDCVLNIGHGEYEKVVIAPGDSKEALRTTIEAFYLSQKYRVLVIILGDKHLAESHFTFDKLEKPKVKVKDFILKKIPKNYKSYKITKTGISPRAIPGQKAVVRATGYEHGEDGITTEDSKEILKQVEKRKRKGEFLKKEIEKLDPVKFYGKGENLIVSWGSTKGAILDALKELKGFRFLQIIYLKPFPEKIVKKEIEKAKKIYIVENNATSPLSRIIRQETGILIENRILKADGRPFTPSEIVKKIK